MVGLCAVFLVLVFLVAKYSSVESRYECPGELSTTSGLQKKTGYLKLEQYRWWVGLWSDSYGVAWLEIPNEHLEYYGRIAKVGDQLQFQDYSTRMLKGNFSTLSKALAVTVGSRFFDGACKPIQP